MLDLHTSSDLGMFTRASRVQLGWRDSSLQVARGSWLHEEPSSGSGESRRVAAKLWGCLSPWKVWLLKL